MARTPSIQDVEKSGKVTHITYRNHFGSFINAQKAAGLVPNNRGGEQKYSHEFLISHLKELAEQLGKTPSQRDVEDTGKVSATTYRDYFGSFIKAQKAAGLVPNKSGGKQKYSDEFLLNHLKELAKQLGETPFQKDINTAGKVKATTYRDYFGSFTNAQKVAGLVPNESFGQQKYADEYLLNDLKVLSKQLGKHPPPVILKRGVKSTLQLIKHISAVSVMPNKRQGLKFTKKLVNINIQVSI